MFKICNENKHQNRNPKETECPHKIFGWKTLSLFQLDDNFDFLAIENIQRLTIFL